ncbi:MAG TPA: MerR family transcriptional regulator [Terriglobia bacterium]|nr:MerR family transcriptional regulator [Terriglobia bacterium]
MKNSTETLHRAGDFARRAGVTVRTLHHYDRLGLLKPGGRTEAGYRLYAQRDFARLEEIVTLKFIGFSLKQIKELLEGEAFDMTTTLRLQRKIMEEKRRHLELAIQAIKNAERALASRASARKPDWEIFRKIIEVINMQQNTEWTRKYYTEEARKELDARKVPQEVIEQGQRDWAALIQELEAAVKAGRDPASGKAQALAGRWQKLIEGFTGGSPAVAAGLNKLYSDKVNWPSTFKKPYSDEAGAFICRAIELRKNNPS